MIDICVWGGMSRTCTSPRKVLLAGWDVAKAVLPAYSHCVPCTERLIVR